MFRLCLDYIYTTTATMAVPSTLGSSLANIIRNVIKSFPGPKGTRVRVLEVPGVPILRGLITNNPFKIRKCGRTKCPFMTHDEDCNKKCQIENIVYRAICKRCTVKEHCYEGETSRTLYTRSVNHFDDYKSASKNNVTQDMSVDKKSSWMWDHIRDVHNGDPNPQNPQLDFKFAVVSSHRDSMERQIKEACKIQTERMKHNLLNSLNL